MTTTFSTNFSFLVGSFHLSHSSLRYVHINGTMRQQRWKIEVSYALSGQKLWLTFSNVLIHRGKLVCLHKISYGVQQHQEQ